MIRIATLTAAKYDWSHGVNFSQIINGCTPERAEAAGIKFIAPAAGQLCEDAKVVALWTPDPDRTRVIAQALKIPRVLDRPDEAVGQVDAVISSDDGCEEWADRNASWAEPYIAAGTPVFLDKPLSHSAQQSEDIVSLARNKNTPVLCCSGIRFTQAVLDQKARIADLGDIIAADGAGPLAWLFFYGVHVIDPLTSLVGAGAQWVEHLGGETQHVVVVGYEGERTVCFRSLQMAYGFHFSLFGSGGVARFSILPDDPDFAEEHFHIRTVRAAIEMFRTGNMPVSYDEQLEVAKILTYAKASLLNGGKRYLLSDPPPN